MVVRGRDGGGDAGVVQAAGAGLWGLWVCVGVVEIRGWLGRLGAAALCSVPAHHIEFLMYNYMRIKSSKRTPTPPRPCQPSPR